MKKMTHIMRVPVSKSILANAMTFKFNLDLEAHIFLYSERGVTKLITTMIWWGRDGISILG